MEPICSNHHLLSNTASESVVAYPSILCRRTAENAHYFMLRDQCYLSDSAHRLLNDSDSRVSSDCSVNHSSCMISSTVGLSRGSSFKIRLTNSLSAGGISFVVHLCSGFCGGPCRLRKCTISKVSGSRRSASDDGNGPKALYMRLRTVIS